MTDEHKDYNLVHYCIGCDITGQPIYATHFIDKRKPKPNFPFGTGTLSSGWKLGKRVFQHEHNH